jgi:virginiamycin B lyase
LVRFDPDTASFKSFDLPSKPGNVRQIHGRPGQILGAESAYDQLIVIEY